MLHTCAHFLTLFEVAKQMFAKYGRETLKVNTNFTMYNFFEIYISRKLFFLKCSPSKSLQKYLPFRCHITLTVSLHSLVSIQWQCTVIHRSQSSCSQSSFVKSYFTKDKSGGKINTHSTILQEMSDFFKMIFKMYFICCSEYQTAVTKNTTYAFLVFSSAIVKIFTYVLFIPF